VKIDGRRAYDRARELIIDPRLAWATYLGGGGTVLGGSGDDYGLGVATDGSGNVYVTGYTASGTWIPAGYDTSINGSYDAFVAKLNASGSSLLYATYLGGTYGDRGRDIAVDSAGNAYITGSTGSSGWATAGAYDNTFNGIPAINGSIDAFVAKLSASGSSLLYGPTSAELTMISVMESHSMARATHI